MEPLKGLILSGGAGTRLRPITHTSAKQLVPVANKPVLFYGIEALVDAGVEEIGIIIAPETGDEIREAAGDGSQFGAEITYIVQDKPAGPRPRGADRRGLHRRLAVRHVPRRQPPRATASAAWSRPSASAEPDALILLTPVDDPQSYGVAELDDDDHIVRLIEKPKDPPSNLALVGVYLFSTSIFDAARALEPSWRGELEITEAIQTLIDDGHSVQLRGRARLVEGHRPARRHARGQPPRAGGAGDPARRRDRRGSRVEGRVVIEPGRHADPLGRPRPGRDRRRRLHRGRLHRPLHLDRRRRPRPPLRGRALDRPRRLGGRGPRQRGWRRACSAATSS